MATAHPIEPAAAAPATPIGPQTAEPVDLPWIVDDSDAPPLPKAAPRQRPKPPLRQAVIARAPEPVHWSIVALTVATMASIVFGAHGVPASKASLPVMVFAPAR